MLIFNYNTNIFTYDEGLRNNYLPLVSKTNLIPFQLYYNDTVIIFKSLELIFENESIDVTAAITGSVKSYTTGILADGCWILYAGGVDLSAVLECGVYQLKLTMKRKSVDYVFYSNFFKVVEASKLTSNLKLLNSKDFETRYFSSGYFDRIYLREFFIRKIENYLYEDTTDNGDGTETINLQTIAEQYEIKLYCDKFCLRFLETLKLYDTVTFTHLHLSNEEIYEFLDIETVFNTELMIYEVTITLKIKDVSKNNCLENLDVWEYTDDEIQQKINDAGDLLEINATPDILIIT